MEKKAALCLEFLGSSPPLVILFRTMYFCWFVDKVFRPPDQFVRCLCPWLEMEVKIKICEELRALYPMPSQISRRICQCSSCILAYDMACSRPVNIKSLDAFFDGHEYIVHFAMIAPDALVHFTYVVATLRRVKGTFPSCWITDFLSFQFLYVSQTRSRLVLLK